MNHRRGGVLRKMLGKNRDCDSFLVLMLAAMLCSSCATIISGSTAQIQIDGNVDEPVTVVTSMGEYHDLSLPATVKVRRRSLDGQHIQINSESYAFSDIILRKSVNPWVDNNSPDYVSRDKPEPLFIDGTDKIKWRMAYQLTALGVSLGSDNFHLFGELGYGSLGIVRVGLGIAL